MKIVFFGTPDYVLPVLKSLGKHFEIVAVVTQKPAPIGRKKILSYSPVDTWAHKRKIPIIFDFEKIPSADLGVCAAYGKIIPKFVICNLKFGILNIHPSLLPSFRGASPVPATIITGTNPTGVTIFKMDEKIDHGPIVSQFKEEVLTSDTAGTLRTRLFEKSTQVLIELLPAYISGKIKPRLQDESQATYSKILSKQDGFIKLSKTGPNEAERFIRAMDPWPGAWTSLRPARRDYGRQAQKRLKILKAHIDPDTGYLILDTVQLEGKNPVSWKQFSQAYPTFLLS